MELEIGARIAAFRRAKGMTQEQVAEALGISAPAVSKWETDTSYPDITLLCPLARVLGTNVDTLLEFEEELPDEAAMERVNEVVETARTKELKTAEEALQKLLHKYPTSMALKYYAVIAISMFALFFPMSSDEKKKAWKKQKKQLLLSVHEMEYRHTGRPPFLLWHLWRWRTMIWMRQRNY